MSIIKFHNQKYDYSKFQKQEEKFIVTKCER